MASVPIALCHLKEMVILITTLFDIAICHPDRLKIIHEALSPSAGGLIPRGSKRHVFDSAVSSHKEPASVVRIKLLRNTAVRQNEAIINLSVY